MLLRLTAPAYLRSAAVGMLTCVALVLAPSARADPLPVTSVSPANGATIAPLGASVAGLTLELTSPITRITGMYAEVATQASPLGQDGTLADDFQKDFFPLFESDAYPGTYRGTSNHVPNGGWWTSTPGTYYWQVSATYIDYSTFPSQLKTYISPVYTITIAAPQPAPVAPAPVAPAPSQPLFLSKHEAVHASRSIIKDHTGHTAHRLKSRCSRSSDTRVRCRLTWDNGARSARRLWFYTGTMNVHERQSDYAYSFRGYRANGRCIHRRSVKACMRGVGW